MKLIKFVKRDGDNKVIYVNPDHVVSVDDYVDAQGDWVSGNTRLLTLNGGHYVKGSPSEVNEKLGRQGE